MRTWTSRSVGEKSTESEYDGPLVLLDNLQSQSQGQTCFRQSAATLTLKQTKSENGSVTATMPHEIMVRSHPQRPMPLSDSSAESGKKEGRSSVKVWQIGGERALCTTRRAARFRLDDTQGTHHGRRLRPSGGVLRNSLRRRRPRQSGAAVGAVNHLAVRGNVDSHRHLFAMDGKEDK